MATLDENGLTIRRQDEVFQALVDDLRSDISDNIKTNPESVVGNFTQILSFHMADLEALAEDIRSSGYILSATGASLDELVARAGITRVAAKGSTVTLTLTGTDSTVIPAGSTVRDPVSLIEWTTDADATITGGTVDVAATSVGTGPIIGLAGTITEIVDSVAGWDTVTNALDAEPGNDVEGDPALRERYITNFTAARRSSTGLYATLLAVEGVTQAVIIENRSNVTDAAGRPAHSFEAYVQGGADQDIWDAIWENTPQGIESYGTEVGTAVDEHGDNQTVKFSRISDINAWVQITYTAGANAPDNVEDDIEADVLAYGNTLLAGNDLYPTRILQNIETPGLTFLAVRVNTTGTPFSTDDPLGSEVFEQVQLDSSRLVFVQS